MTEEELLFKYRHGKTIDKEDMDEVLQLSYWYQMHTGFYVKENEIIPTAKTTKQGKFFLSINTSFFTRVKWFFKYLMK